MKEHKNRTIAELMVPLQRYPHILTTAPMHEALTLLGHQPYEGGTANFRNVLVLEENGELTGILSIHTLLKAIEPKLLKVEPGEAAEGYWGQPISDDNLAMEIFWKRLLANELEHGLDLASRTAGQLAEPTDKVLPPEALVAHGLQVLLGNDLFMLPVVAEDNKVVGTLRLADIFNLLVNQVLGENQ